MSSKQRVFAAAVAAFAFGAVAVAQAAPIPLSEGEADEPIRPHIIEREVMSGGAIRDDARKVERKARLQAKRERQRRIEKAWKPVGGAIEGVPVSTLESIASCESGGDPTAVNAAGYYGKYQFSTETWAAVGGSGNPAEASEAEQDYRAAVLYNTSGPGQWPVCGQ